MAKKRARRTSHKAVSSSNVRAFRIADILVSIAIAFTLINAVLILFFSEKAVEAATIIGLQTTSANWQMLGAAWIFLALFAYIANKWSRVTLNRHTMWGLLIVGLLLGITGRMESAVLTVIAAGIYLYKSKK